MMRLKQITVIACGLTVATSVLSVFDIMYGFIALARVYTLFQLFSALVHVLWQASLSVFLYVLYRNQIKKE